MTVAKVLLTRSKRAVEKAVKAADPETRGHWLQLADTWHAMAEVHQQHLDPEFEKAQIKAVRARVKEAREAVHRQMRHIEILRRAGAMTQSARAVLNTLCESLSLHSACLEKLVRDSRKGAGQSSRKT